MRILLTGWRGYVGGAALAAARERGHAISVLVRADDEAAAAAAAGLGAIQGTLGDAAALASASAGVDAVIHCAASDAPAFQPLNLSAVTAMLDGLPGDARFVLHGGTLVFGPTGPAPARPSVTAPPPFLAARAAIDQLVLDRAAAGARAVGVYGAFIHGGGRGAAIPASWAAAARAAGYVALPGGGAARWSHCHVADWGRLLVLAAERAEPGEGPLFAAAGQASIAELGETLAAGLGLPARPVAPEAAAEAGPFGPALLLNQLFDDGPARARFGWAPHGPALADSLTDGL